MLSPFHSFLLAQLPVNEAGQLLLVTGIAFAVITLIASTHRFHRMIQLDDKTLETEEDRNNFFYIQTTRYLSKINRISSGFGFFILQIQADLPERQAAQKQVLDVIRNLIRRAEDKACLYKEDCIGIIIDTEDERVSDVAKRLHTDLTQRLSALPGVTGWRAGFSSFPTHGLNTREINSAATTALEAAATEGPAQMNPAPAPEKPSDEDFDEKPDLSELGKKDKNPALDPLTGVLRPKVVGSYMRKYMAELRRKKDPGSLLCVGINRIDQIISLHGEVAADNVIAGVSKVLQSLTRDSDLIGRYHRDDFLVLAPCTLQEGEKIAERLRKAVQKEVFISSGKRIKASVSIGISAYPEHGRLLRDLFRKGHLALEILRGWNTTACLVYDPDKHESASFK